MQPYIFPYIGYFQLIGAVDKFIFYDDVNFINKGWINRNNILVNGKAHLFTIPLMDASQNKRINEIALFEDESWKNKFLKTVEHAYKKAPYISEVILLIKDVLYSGLTQIQQLTKTSITLVSQFLDLETKFVESSSQYNNFQLKGQNRILDICIKENADQYINPIGGQEIYSKELFDGSGLKLSFIRSNLTSYRQLGNEFVPNLSIIDVLMFNSKKAVKSMLGEYQLI